ncbi:DNA translocase FtsK [Enterobacter roggenkampii]|nr:DNA translocase FtsK [Enterobacter roggenkampii]
MDNHFDYPLIEPAIEWVVINQKVSIAGIQRNFRIGYNRAGQLVELMENIGLVSPQGFDGNRTVLCAELEIGLSLFRQYKDAVDEEPDMTNVILFPGKK